MEKIMLYSGIAPYTEYSPDQAQPSITFTERHNAPMCVVVCPGGGYAMKADHEGIPIAEMINDAGIDACVLDYRVAPCHMEAPLSDAKRAIRVARSMGYEKVAIMGFSAGGHLTCSAAVQYDRGHADDPDPIERLSSRPDAFVPCYPVASFGPYTHMGSRKALLGEKADDPELVRRFSTEENITFDTPPAFIWHTANDEAVPVENSLMLASALSAHNVPFELHIFPEGVHGLGLATDHPNIAKWADMLKTWLKSLI